MAAWRVLHENSAGEPGVTKRELAFEFTLLLLWALLPATLTYTVSFVKAVFLPRYLVFSTVGLLLLMISGVERARLWAGVAMIAALYALSIQYQVMHAHRHSKGQYRETIAQIAAIAGPDDVLYVRGDTISFRRSTTSANDGFSWRARDMSESRRLQARFSSPPKWFVRS